MNIYIHTPREWYELYELGRRQFGCFIGHTGHDIIEHRFDDGDYSHFIEQPNVLRTFTDIHKDIKDHWIHEALENEPGWFRYCKLNKLGRSPDFFVTDLDPEEALKVIENTVSRINNHFHEYELQHNESPAKVRKLQRKRLQDYHRIPTGKLLDYLYKTVWQYYNKDSKIAVIRDAHGRICEYLLDKGFTNITTDEDIKSLSVEKLSRIKMVSVFSGQFDYVIGNPPYNEQMYRKFLDKIDTMLDDDGKFDLLFPVYIYTRSKCVSILKSKLKLESVDMTPGQYFMRTVSGAWVVRISGTKGITDTFDLTYPDGTIEGGCTLDHLNPSSAIFIEDMVKNNLPGLLPVDRQLANRILDSTVQLTPHKTGPIPCEHFCYLSPIIRRMTQKGGDPFPGILHLRTMTSQSKDTQNGYYIECTSQEEAESLAQIYGFSDLFVYLFYLVASDSIYADNFIKKLPKIDLESDIVLSEDEVKRINQVLR